MIKKILALAVTALLSTSASAGYIRYDFTGDMSGYFVQSDIDKSIIDYNFFANDLAYFEPGSGGGLYNQRSSFWGVYGPTNFSANAAGGDFEYLARVTVNFNGMYSDAPNNFSAYFTLDEGYGYPSYAPPFQAVERWVYGSVVASIPTAEQLAFYNQYGYYYVAHQVVVQNVPEPTSIALLAIGALGAAGVARRRKTAA